MGLVAILTHCLKWWQQAGLATIFGILLACAVAAAFYALKGRSPAGTRPSGPLLIQYAGYGLGDEGYVDVTTTLKGYIKHEEEERNVPL